METRSVHPVYATLAGFALIGTGLCLARYAYTPLIPALINAGWVDKAGAGYLGGFNCLGYILGCIAALRLPATLPAEFTVTDADMMMGGAWPDEVWIEARLDADGDAMTKTGADLRSGLVGPLTSGETGLSVVLGGS